MRDQDTGNLLELLLIMAVAAILVSRAFLALTGYPQLSPGQLHIAHMLWGGLLMLAALVTAFRYWNPSVRRLAAFMGGVGFGLFIDELGKFITKDSDYFYKPTIALIYVLFILLYLIFRGLSERHDLSERERQVNEAIRLDLGDMRDTPSRMLHWYDSLSGRLGGAFERVIAVKGVVTVLMAAFVLLNLAQLGVVLGIESPDWLPTRDASGLAIVGMLISGLLVAVGVVVLRRSSLRGFIWFKRAVLVNIFITQIFLFNRSQLTAVWGLAVNLAFYAGIERHIRSRTGGP
ncbi:MAG: hypothetical protein R6U36_06085 [Candidatus Fermentibacteraceae bacterium]